MGVLGGGRSSGAGRRGACAGGTRRHCIGGNGFRDRKALVVVAACGVFCSAAPGAIGTLSEKCSVIWGPAILSHVIRLESGDTYGRGNELTDPPTQMFKQLGLFQVGSVHKSRVNPPTLAGGWHMPFGRQVSRLAELDPRSTKAVTLRTQHMEKIFAVEIHGWYAAESAIAVPLG